MYKKSATKTSATKSSSAKSTTGTSMPVKSIPVSSTKTIAASSKATATPSQPKSSPKFVILLFVIFLFLAALSILSTKTNLIPENLKSLKFLKSNSTPSKEAEQKSQEKMVIITEEDATVKVVESASPAVVSVVRKEVLFNPLTGPFRSEDSIGTGFIVDGKNGIVFTNKHVVNADNATYSVILGDGKESYDVDKVYRDPLNDFAILKLVMKPDSNLPQLNLGNSDNIKVGQTVIAIGNALGQFGNSITKGIVSGLKRPITASSGTFGQTELLEDVIQTDAALNPGNSGGPLLNLNGEVVGINVATSLGAENIGFAIPVNLLKPVIDGFNTNGKISRPYMGVHYSIITEDMATKNNFPQGAFISQVVPNSPADEAGIEPGDIILKVNGESVTEQNQLSKIISKLNADSEIEVLINRNGKEETFKVTLKEIE